MKNLYDYILLPREERQEHLDLTEACIERGGHGTEYRGVLAQYLDTTFPKNRIAVLAHACNNAKCSNPRHLYWGTYYENNILDGRKFGTHKSVWESMVEKYGFKEACKMNSRKGNTHGTGNKNIAKSEKHKKNLSESLKKMYADPDNISSRKGGRHPDPNAKILVDTVNELGIKKASEKLELTYQQVKNKFHYYKNRF